MSRAHEVAADILRDWHRYREVGPRFADEALAVGLRRTIDEGSLGQLAEIGTAPELFTAMFQLGIGRYRRFLIERPGFSTLDSHAQRDCLLALAEQFTQISEEYGSL